MKRYGGLWEKVIAWEEKVTSTVLASSQPVRVFPPASHRS